MNKEQALELIRQACAAFRGTLQEHKALQQALEVLTNGDKDNTTEQQKN